MKTERAKVIILANSKGGCGKSLAAAMVSSELSNRMSSSISGRKFRVLICDSDPQGTSTEWSKASPNGAYPSLAVLNFSAYEEKIHREIQKQIYNYDFIVVDCASSLLSLATQSALLISDLAIIPLPPSPGDLWAAFGMKKMIAIAQTINPGLKAVILPNRVVRTSLSKAIMSELENFGIPLMKSRIFNRTAYQEAVIAGVSVADLGRDAKPAADEIRALTDEVLELLGE